MNLLPRNHREFQSSKYWDKFFSKRGNKAFEWYGEFNELCSLISKYIKTKDNILVIGCGNSNLSCDMYDIGYLNMTNIDINQQVINQMLEKCQEKKNMKFIQMDVTKMTFDDGQFSVVVDKGTLDALLTDLDELTIIKVDKMLKEITRVLKFGGRYFCVSLAQEHILRKLLTYFSEKGWMCRVCHVVDIEPKEKENFSHPVFVFVITKVNKIPDMSAILEVAATEKFVQRFSSIEQVVDSVQQIQHYAVIRHQLAKGLMFEEDLTMDLYSTETNTPRYSLTVVDLPKGPHIVGRFAIFIVPEGREADWLFSTAEGRLQLAQNIRFQRIVVVLLHRDQNYIDLASIQDELSTKVLELGPADLGTGIKVPFLSVGDNIHKRKICERGNSELSGEFVVEDVDCEGVMVRQLIFLSHPHIIQTQVPLVRVRRKRSRSVSPGVLSTSYASFMVAGLSFHDISFIDCGANLLLVGLGGGQIAAHLRKHFSKLHIDALEIDLAIVEVARKWFSVCEDERLSIHVCDGLDYMRSAAKGSYDCIILDVDCKDSSLGISCPPPAFISSSSLTAVKNILADHGMLILNLVSRSPTKKEELIKTLKEFFESLYSIKVPNDVNQVIFAFKNKPRSEMTDKMKHKIDKANYSYLEDIYERFSHLVKL